MFCGKRFNIILFTVLLPVLAACSTAAPARKLDGPWQTYTHVSYGEEESQFFDVTVPNIIPENLNAIVFIHGFTYGRMDETQDWTLFDHYKDRFVFCNLNYRFFGQGDGQADFDSFVQDVHNGIAGLKQFMSEQDITINKVIIAGHSLGGTMALLYCYKFYDPVLPDVDPPYPIAFCVELSAPTDFTDANHIAYINDKGIALNIERITALIAAVSGVKITEDMVMDYLKSISPRFFAHEFSPPTIIVHDTRDDLIPYSGATALNATLDVLGVPHILIASTDNLGHTLGGRGQIRKINPALEKRVLAAMDEYIKLYCE